MWRYLNTPDDFHDDWYGELTNQLAHTFLGAIITCIISSVNLMATGDFMHRWFLFAIVSLGYALVIELGVQKWRAGDSWFDWLMVSFGAALLIWPLKEVETGKGRILLEFQPEMLLGISAAWVLALTLRVLKRM